MTKKKQLLSAIVLAKNEAQRLPTCIDALRFCDEIIVIDNGSTDDTPELAKKLGAKVIRSLDTNFSNLHNLGAREARGDWLVYVDADERVTDELARSIVALIDSSCSAIRLTRKNYYLGYAWPAKEQLIRCMKSASLIRWEGAVHETAVVKGTVCDASGYLIHTTHRTLEEMVHKTNTWSTTESRLRYETKHPPIVPWRLARVFLTGFWKSYWHESGWRVGTAGFIESVYQGFSLFITYAKLWELQQV